MEPSEVHSWLGHKGHQPTDEFHWTQNNMRRAVAIRRFEFNNDAAAIRQ